MPEIGDKAPEFTLPSVGDRIASLADFKGKAVVLYFYPRDDTSGCTKEAVAFTELLPEFEAADAVVLGISTDSVKKHEKFAAKHELGVTLLSDELSTACEDYGVWKEKNMYGRKYMGIERTTYLIGADGIIKNLWRKVKVPGHADAVLRAVKEL